MATLPTLRPSSYVSGTLINTSAVGNVSDASDATWVESVSGNGVDGQWVYELDNTPSLFASMDTATLTVRCALNFTGDDTWRVRLYLADTAGAALYALPTYVDLAQTTAVQEFSFTVPTGSIASNTKATWDSVRLIVDYQNVKSKGADGNVIRIMDAWATGTYTSSNPPPATPVITAPVEGANVSGTVSLEATVSDPDADNVYAVWELHTITAPGGDVGATDLPLTADPSNSWHSGIAYDGTSLWVCVMSPSTIYEVSPVDGSTISSFVGPNLPMDITWDGTHLVIMTQTGGAYKYDRAGNQISNPVPDSGTTGMGIGYDSATGNLLIGLADRTIREVDPANGTVLNSFSTGSVQPSFLYVDDGFCFMTNTNSSDLHKYDLATGTLVDTYTIRPSSPLGTEGIAIGETYLYAVNEAADIIMRLDPGSSVLVEDIAENTTPVASGSTHTTSWNAGGVADGDYELRAWSIDSQGLSSDGYDFVPITVAGAAPSTTLVVNDSTHGHTSEEVTATRQAPATLVVNDSTHGHTSEEVTATRQFLPAWGAALENAAIATADILFIGDSVAEGFYATTHETRWTTRLVRMLQERRNAPGVEGGSGYRAPNSSTMNHEPSGFVYGGDVMRPGAGGSGENQGWALGRRYAALDASGEYAEVSFHGTGCIVYFTVGTGTGTADISIDGGAPTTVNTYSATLKSGQAWVSPVLADGDHTIRITWGSALVVIDSVFAFNGDADSGVRQWDAAHAGFMASDHNIETLQQWSVITNAAQPELAIINLGYNDFESGVATSTYQTNMQGVIAKTKTAYPSTDVLVLMLHKRSDATQAQWDGYVAAAEAAAIAENVYFLDLQSVLPAPTGPDGNTYYNDDVHPLDPGHEAIATEVHKRISPPFVAVEDSTHGHTSEQATITPTATPSYSLVVNSATHAHTSEQATLTEAAVLVVADAAHSHESENVTITYRINAPPHDSLHTHTSGQATLTEHPSLVVEDSRHVHSSDKASAVPTNALAAQDSTHGHASEQVALTEHASLSASDATHGHLAAGAAISHAYPAAAGDSSHEHTSESVALSASYSLVALDSRHAQTADNVTISHSNDLAVGSAVHGHSSDLASLSVAYDVAPQGALHGHASEQAGITEHSSLLVEDSHHAHTSEKASAVPLGTVDAQDSTHGHASEEATLSEHAVVAVADSRHPHEAGTASVTHAYVLGPQDSVHGHTSETSGVITLHGLIPDDSLHEHASEQAVATENPSLAVGDSFHAHTSDKASALPQGSVAVQDSTHGHTSEQSSLTEHALLDVADSMHDHTSEQASAIERDGLAAHDARHEVSSDPATVTEHPGLAAQDSRHEVSSDQAGVAEFRTVAAQDAFHGHGSDEATLTATAAEAQVVEPPAVGFANVATPTVIGDMVIAAEVVPAFEAQGPSVDAGREKVVVYVDGQPVNAVPRVYVNGEYKQASVKVYRDGAFV